MPTIKDIARAAGVSQGTVSNVLNNRGNVSVEKINLVKKAARDLGYQTNEKARLLREGASRSVAVILPDLKIPCYAELYSELQEYFTKRSYTVSLYQTQDIPSIELSVLKQLEASIVDGILAVTCLSNAYEAYDTPLLNHTKKIFALRRPSMDCSYVGFDFLQAGAEVGSYVSQKGYRTAALFLGPGRYSNEEEFLEGFQSTWNSSVSQPDNISGQHQVAAGQSVGQHQANADRTLSQYQANTGNTPKLRQANADRPLSQQQANAGNTPKLRQANADQTLGQHQANADNTLALHQHHLSADVAPTIHVVTAEYMEITKAAFDLLSLSPRPECIVAADTAYADAVKTAFYYSGIDATPELIVLSPAGIQKASPPTEYQLDYQRLGQELGNTFFSQETFSQKRLPTKGFPPSAPWLSLDCPVQELHLLTIHSPATEALRKLLPLFLRETGIQVNLHPFSYDETFQTIQAFGNSKTYDLLRLDVAWAPRLASEYLTPFSEIPGYTKELFHHVAPELLSEYCTFGDIPSAFPLDPSVQLLFYRKDLFEDAALRRGYYEKYKEELKAPQTFSELNQVAQYFTRSYVPESPTAYGMTMVAGNTLMASCEMIPRMLALKDAASSEPSACTKATQPGSCIHTRKASPARKPPHTSALLSEPPFALNSPSALAALENYLECSGYCKNPHISWWDEAAKEFASGSTAMTILFSNHASDLLKSPSTKVAGKLGFAPVPGKKPLLGGGILGIARGSARKEASMKFLQWFARDDIALMFALLGGASGNPAVYDSMELLRRYPWMQEVQKNLSLGISRKSWLCPEKPVEERRVEEALGIAIRNALAGTVSPQHALDYAQQSIEPLL